MKRINIFPLVLGIAFLLSGCGIFHIKGNVPNYEEETYIISTMIEDVVLQEEDVSVQICSSDNENLYLSYYCADDDSEQYEITEDKGTLLVTKESKNNYGIFLFGDQYTSDSYKDVKLTLFIPDNYEGDLSIQTLDGDIVIGDVVIEKLTINTKDGNVSFDDTTITQSLSCKTKDGNVKGKLGGKISECNFKTMTINGKNNFNSNIGGNKTIEITTKDGDIDILFDKESK